MNIADKLKNTLSEVHVDDASLNFMHSEKDQENLNKRKAAKINIATVKPKLARLNKFEDLIIKAVNKIENTPCWSKFSMETKEQMISKYFETKIKEQEITYNRADKLSFVTEVLKSVV